MDDAAATRLQHHRHHRARHADVAHQIEAERVRPVLVLEHYQEPAAGTNEAGVVEQDVEAPECAHALFNH